MPTATPPPSRANFPDRYDRQQRLAGIGAEGQQRLAAARVTILGCGALGSAAAELLARAGVGQLRLVDRDVVEPSNLQRQLLYTEADARLGRAKAAAAAARLAEINSDIELDPLVVDVAAGNILQILDASQLVVDATDNFQCRLLLNDAAIRLGLPWVHGGCVGTEGQVMTVLAGQTPCFRCLVPHRPDPAAVATCDTAGVLGPATCLVASLQATAAIRVLVGGTDGLGSEMTVVDLWRNRFRVIDAAPLKDPACPACGRGQLEYLDCAAAAEPEVLCGRHAVQIPGSRPGTVDLARVARRWQGMGTVVQRAFLARLELPQHRITLFGDGRAVIDGTEDPAEARALYDRFVGS